MSPPAATFTTEGRVGLDAAKQARLRHLFRQGVLVKVLSEDTGTPKRTLERWLAQLGLVRHLGAANVPQRDATGEVAMRLLQARGPLRKANARRILDCLELLHLREVSGVVRWEDWGRICTTRATEGPSSEERLAEAQKQAFFRLAEWLRVEARIRLTTNAGQWIDGRRVVSFSLRRLRRFVGRRDGRVERRALEVLGYGDGDDDGDGECGSND